MEWTNTGIWTSLIILAVALFTNKSKINPTKLVLAFAVGAVCAVGIAWVSLSGYPTGFRYAVQIVGVVVIVAMIWLEKRMQKSLPER
jgi:lipoprotein signal peptidase